MAKRQFKRGTIAMPNGDPKITRETRAAVQALADTTAVVLAVLFRNEVLTGDQVRSVVADIKMAAGRAPGETNPVRILEGSMLTVIAEKLDDATGGL